MTHPTCTRPRPPDLLAAVLGAALALLTLAARAQEAPSGTWDERRAVERALARAPEVRRALSAVAEARAQRAYGEVSAVGNPTLGVRALVGAPDLSAATYALFVGIPFDVGGVRGRWRSEASWALREAEARAAVALNEARSRARRAWVDVAVGAALRRVAAERVEAATQAVAQAQARADAQAATALDVALAERERAEATADLSTVRRELAEAEGRLREVLDLAADEAVEVAPLTEPPAAPEGSAAAAAGRAHAQRREAAAFGAAAVRLRRSADRLRAGAIDPLLVAGEVEWQGYSAASVGASAQWSLPVSHTAQGDRAVAGAQAATAALERDLAARSAEREAATAWAALAHARDELAEVDAQVLPGAERALALTEALFRAGAADAYRVLFARQAVTAARVRRLGALREAWRARVELDRATGGP